MSSSSCINKIPKFEGQIEPSSPTELGFGYCEENVISTTNTAIDIILDAINKMPKSSRTLHCAQLYNAVDVLRKMTPNNGNRMHVNQLPDDCLVTIFTKNFSLQKIIGSFRQVCHKWKAVVEDSICAPKRSLKLFGADSDVTYYAKKLVKLNMYADEQFKLRRMRQHDFIFSRPWKSGTDLEFFRTLGMIFSNVQHLVISVHAVSDSKQRQLSQFVAYFPALVRLSVFCRWSSKEKSPPTEYNNPFFLTINTCKQTLKQLDLLGDSMRCCYNIADCLGQVLPQLEHLSMENGQYNDNLGSVLAKLGVNLKSLRLIQFDNIQDVIRGSLKLELTGNITELRLSQVTDLKIVQFVCKTFAHLNKLDLSFQVGKYQKPTFVLSSQLLTTLNLLPHLYYLSLENLQIDLNSLIPSTFAPSTVKSLHISNLCPSKTQTDGAQLVRVLSSIFPLIEQLDYQFGIPAKRQIFQYEDCKINDNFVREHFAHLRECHLYYRHCKNEYVARPGYCRCSNAFLFDSYSDDSESDLPWF